MLASAVATFLSLLRSRHRIMRIVFVCVMTLPIQDSRECDPGGIGHGRGKAPGINAKLTPKE